MIAGPKLRSTRAGIGKALSLRLASQGVNVVLVAKPDNILNNTHDELQTAFPNLQFRKVGVAHG